MCQDDLGGSGCEEEQREGRGEQAQGYGSNRAQLYGTAVRARPTRPCGSVRRVR